MHKNDMLIIIFLKRYLFVDRSNYVTKVNCGCVKTANETFWFEKNLTANVRQRHIIMMAFKMLKNIFLALWEIIL